MTDESTERPERKSARQSIRPGGAQSLVGTVVSGRYRIERLLGEGGMGAVYQAEHTHMRKRLAVKVLHSEMSRLPEVVQRFEREAVAASHIDHPNVAGATDFGKLEDGSFFLVLEYVEGKSLRDAITAGRLELGRALHIARQIAAALSRAHSLGIVHRDLKPENVMLIQRDADADFVKVLDFGIAKVPVGELASEPTDGKALTQLGMVYGTPEYMAPEQALGQHVDARADLYALGIIMYEMLAGKRPFEHDSKVALLGMHVTAPVPKFADRAPAANVPAEVEAIIGKLLAKEAQERFGEAKELIEALAAQLGALSAAGTIEPRFAAYVAGPTSMRDPLASLAGIPSAPQIIVPEIRLGPMKAATLDPLKRMVVRLRTADRQKQLTIGGGALGLIVLVVVVSMMLGGGKKTATDSGTVDEPVVIGSGSVSVPEKQPPAKPEVEARIQSAIALVEKGDYATGIEQLAPLEGENPSRSDIHRALEHAYLETRQAKDAMRELGLVFILEPSATKEQKLQVDARDTAIGKDASDEAFTLLEDSMGADGPEVLYNIAYELPPGPYAHSILRAKKLLAKPDIRTKMSPALDVTLDIRASTPCGAKKFLERAGDVGDRRTLDVLRSYTPTSGCGFLGRRDCYACLHDGSLRDAMTEIERRLKSAPK
jgi:serine/threonine-protein kinase